MKLLGSLKASLGGISFSEGISYDVVTACDKHMTTGSGSTFHSINMMHTLLAYVDGDNDEICNLGEHLSRGVMHQ